MGDKKENLLRYTEWNSYLYSNNYNTFDEWLELINNRDEEVYPFCKIPCIKWFNEYIENIKERTVDEVKNLVRNLLLPVNRELDYDSYNTYKVLKEKYECLPVEMRRYVDAQKSNEKFIRLKNGLDAWESITWVVGMLPQKPYKAIEVLQCYLSEQIYGLPDDRITGIEQCIEIILAKFIFFDEPAKKLLELKPVEFEWLVEELYKGMGYKTKWTKATRDVGKEIIADINRYDGSERVYVECKLYNTTKLKNETVKSFAYTISDEKINRGVIFCTGYVSDSLKKIDRRIQILTYQEIVILLNAHLGSNWVENLSYILKRKREEYNK